MLVGDSAGGSEDQLRRAQWEAATRAGRSLGVRYRVQGWRDALDIKCGPSTLQMDAAGIRLAGPRIDLN